MGDEKYLVIYDIEYPLRGCFYRKFKRMIKRLGIVKVQQSAYLCPDYRSAKILANYLKQFGDRVAIFKVVQILEG